jgi:hypothetical protein
MDLSFSPGRVRRVVARAWAPYLAVAMLLSGVELAAFVSAVRAFFPGVDPESWTCIAGATPFVLLAWCINFFGATALFVRAFARKKGRARAMHYLFPDVEAGRPSVLSRMLLTAARI